MLPVVVVPIERKKCSLGLPSLLFFLSVLLQLHEIWKFQIDYLVDERTNLSPTRNEEKNLPTNPDQNAPRGHADPKTLLKLQNAGLDPRNLDNDTLRLIPQWQTIEDVLGSSSPHIMGIETCKAFQSIVADGPRYIGVSGLFNTGTNLLAYLLDENCNFETSAPGRTLWAVPWGKHSIAERRDVQIVPGYEDYNKTRVLPAIMVRNPFDVLESMCRNSYSVHYEENVNSTCPHLVHPKTGDLLPVYVGLKKPRIKHTSIIHYFNYWYQGYFHDFHHPKLFIRLEDLTVHPRETVQAICECAGGTVSDNFVYKLSSAKEGMGHGKESESNGLVEAWTRLGRAVSFSPLDYEAVTTHVDQELMTAFRYKPPPLKMT